MCRGSPSRLRKSFLFFAREVFEATTFSIFEKTLVGHLKWLFLLGNIVVREDDLFRRCLRNHFNYKVDKGASF